MKQFIRTIALLGIAAAMTVAGQVPVPPAVQDPNNPAVTPGETAPVVDAQASGNTITVSRTFTNAPGSITIIGTAATEQEKQAIGMKLQEAAPNRTINNQLTVAGQGIIEPSGAEKPKDKSSSEDKNDDSKSQDDSDASDGK